MADSSSPNPKAPHAYVHGYTEREADRLFDQADATRDLLHDGTVYPENSLVLEAGCGVGAQTLTLARRSPGARFLSVDISTDSLAKARERIRQAGLGNVQFQQANLFQLPFEAGEFDHVFVCFVLEHLSNPAGVLSELRRVLRAGGSITVIEGDHGSCYFHPETAEARQAWNCLIEVQARLGGDSLIGRRLYPLLAAANFQSIAVSPRMVYVDDSKSELKIGFVQNTITAMVEGVCQPSLSLGLIERAVWEKGIRDLRAIATGPGGSFCYTFFKAVAWKRE